MCVSIKSLSVYYYIEVLIWVHSEQHLGLLIKMRFVRHVFLYTVQWIREEAGSQETHRGLSTFESVDKPRPRATDFLLAAACRKRERVHNLHQKPTVEWYFHLRTYFTARGVCKANPPQPLSHPSTEINSTWNTNKSGITTRFQGYYQNGVMVARNKMF